MDGRLTFRTTTRLRRRRLLRVGIPITAAIGLLGASFASSRQSVAPRSDPRQPPEISPLPRSYDTGVAGERPPVAPWIVWPPATEQCRPTTGNAVALLGRARAVLKADSLGSNMVRRVSSRLIEFHNYESDRPYRPFITMVTDEESTLEPATGTLRDSTTLDFRGFGDQPPNVTVSLSTPHAVLVRRDTAWVQMDALWRATEAGRQLDPWLVVLDWSATPDVRVVARCLYRDYDRTVLERNGTFGRERLYLDPKSGFPVKVDRDEPQYLWGQQRVEYVYMTWLRFGGTVMPSTAAKLVDGDEEFLREVKEARAIPADGALQLARADMQARSTVTTPVFLRPAPIDTARLSPQIVALRNRGYTELVALSHDTVVVMDATQSEERARADSALIGHLFAGRHPIVVVVTDLAWPHVSGVRFWVASGAAIASRTTSESFLKAVIARRWASPDKLERDRARALLHFLPVHDSLRVAGISLYPIDGIASEGALMAYFPVDRLLWASDYVQDTTAPTLYASEVVAAACRVGLTPERGAAEHVPPFSWSTIAELARKTGTTCTSA
jgi:hypothetical protein